MSFPLDFSDQAIEDVAYHKKSGNKAILKKLSILLDEIADHPFTGTGKPEALKHNLSGNGQEELTRSIDLSMKFLMIISLSILLKSITAN